jgi:DNA-binding transcriptional MerR regulator
MRISDLSSKSGVPVATIKFYLREGLLPQGRPTARNQADYDERHLRRLSLIRIFTTIVDLELSSVREVLAAIEDERVSVPDLYAVVNRVVFPEQRALPPVCDTGRTSASVNEFIARLGWDLAPKAPGRATLAMVLATLRALGCQEDIDFFAPHAAAAQQLAAHELSLLPPDGKLNDRGAAVVRTVLFEVALAAIRRMAQEHYLAVQSLQVDPPVATEAGVRRRPGAGH